MANLKFRATSHYTTTETLTLKTPQQILVFAALGVFPDGKPMSKEDATSSSNRCFLILDPYFPIQLQKSTEVAKSGLYFSTVLSISCMYPGVKRLLERLMFRIPAENSIQIPCIENLERGIVGWGIPNASHLVSENQAQSMLYAH